MSEFHKGVLTINPANEVERISQVIKETVYNNLNRQGAVVATSGGIDSSVTVALAVKALGKDRVLALCLPERDSSTASMHLAQEVIDYLGVPSIAENIGPVLEAFGCYERRDAAVRRIFPEYTSEYKLKITLPQNLVETGRINIYYLTIQSPEGEQKKRRLPPVELLEIIAATNHKQRTRKQYEFYHADRLNYAVLGTPNRLEYDQGFFVKGGDGLADMKPIAHLYKTQVYMLATYLGLPEEVLKQKPTTDTYSLDQTQEEFYFSFPFEEMDMLLWAHNHHVTASEVVSVLGYTTAQIERVYTDIQKKRRTTAYLHKQSLLTEPIPEIQPYIQ
ncbi:MAG: NAD(+) synthase [Calditrichota bacterium]